MADSIELYNPSRTSDPFASFRFKAKAMFAKPITRDEFASMQAQLSRIEEALQDAKLDISNLSTQVAEVHANSVQIGNSTYAATVSLEKNILALETRITLLGTKEIVVTPSSVVITGGPNSKKIIVASQQANSKAIFVAESSDTSVVTVAHYQMQNSLTLNSFIITEICPGSAIIRISDNAVPVTNTATVNVTAS